MRALANEPNDLATVHADDVGARMVDDLYARSPAVIAAVVITLPLLAWVVEAGLHDPWVVVAFAGYAIANLARLALVVVVRRRGDRWGTPTLRHRLFVAGTLAVGLFLAALTIAAYRWLDPAHIALLAVFHTGVMSGALMSLGSSLISYVCYVVPALGSSLVMLALDDRDWGARTLLCLVVVYLAVLAMFATQQYRSRRESFAQALELEQLALRDPLTGLANRRYLEVTMERDQARLLRASTAGAANGPSLCVLVLDIDRFKSLNDTFGHMVGDEVLQDTASVLRDAVRKVDIVCRWGGEEFVIALCDAPREGAAAVAERIRERLAERQLTLPDGRAVSWTCSLGWAVLPGGVAMARSLGWRDALKLADAALYRAKRAGRNRAIGVELGFDVIETHGDLDGVVRALGQEQGPASLRQIA